MFNFLRRLIVPGLTFASIGGLWFLGSVSSDLDRPTTSNMCVDPALVQRAIRAAYSSNATAYVGQSAELKSFRDG